MDGGGVTKGNPDAALGRHEGGPRVRGACKFGLEKEQSTLDQDKVHLTSVGGGKASGQAKSFLGQSSSPAGGSLANDDNPFHEGEKARRVLARSINSASKPGPPKVTWSEAEGANDSTARGQAKRRALVFCKRESVRELAPSCRQ